MVPEKSEKSTDFVNVLLLLLIVSCIGIYLIVTTVLIAKDGVTFIKYAKQLEIAPVKAMLSEFQHPGYPWLIFTAHSMTSFLHGNTSIFSWVYCGQGVALISRLFAIVILYFIGKQLFGARLSFLAIMILILLPNPAKYGSDALSDWPHLCFLAAALLLLFDGSATKRWWLFCFAGLVAGAGYLIRPECVQVVIYGVLWLVIQLFSAKRTLDRPKAIYALVLLLAGFLVVVAPYMKLKGAVFPKKQIGRFVSNIQDSRASQLRPQIISDTTYLADIIPSDIAEAFGEMLENIGETLMWFFILPWVVGLYLSFRRAQFYESKQFFVMTLVILNIPLMVWLYCRHGYISARHTLPLVVFTIFYIPVGLEGLAVWCQKRFSKKAEPSAEVSRNDRFWFLVLFIIGVSICVPKLLMPIRIEKKGYRAAAQWLKANTNSSDTVAVPDKRISFYAQREGPVYESGSIPDDVVYTVMISKNRKDKTSLIKPSGKVEFEYTDRSRRGVNIVICRNL